MFEAVRQLPEHERSAMTLFYIGGYSMDEVATFLEVPVSTVKGRLHSARERLRTMLLDTVADDLARPPAVSQRSCSRPRSSICCRRHAPATSSA